MVIIETSIFTKQIQDVMEDNDYAASGKGKRGGARIIYYWLTNDDQIFMLFAYPKNQQIDLTEAQKKVLMHLVNEELSK